LVVFGGAVRGAPSDADPEDVAASIAAGRALHPSHTAAVAAHAAALQRERERSAEAQSRALAAIEEQVVAEGRAEMERVRGALAN
jgi:anti-sigma factor ChrR (cupin superfamily)